MIPAIIIAAFVVWHAAGLFLFYRDNRIKIEVWRGMILSLYLPLLYVVLYLLMGVVLVVQLFTGRKS